MTMRLIVSATGDLRRNGAKNRILHFIKEDFNYQEIVNFSHP